MSAINILETPRLLLRFATDADIEVLHDRIFGDPDVMRFAFAGVPMTRAQSKHTMRKHFTFGDSLTGIATLTEKPAGEVIGYAGLFPCDVLGADDFEIGFVLARLAWGRGIATEIGQAQLAFGFVCLGCERLLGLVEPRNAASIRALEKVGMRFLKKITKPDRGDRLVYVIEATDWRNLTRE